MATYPSSAGSTGWLAFTLFVSIDDVIAAPGGRPAGPVLFARRARYAR